MSASGLDAFSRPGTEVGKYRIVRRLAVGGMAELYLAEARSLAGFQKLVVLKRILPQYVQSPAFVRMFLDEARVAATLDHPNIAQVYDIGEYAGSYYFAMEYVHGASLLELMRAITAKRRPLPLEHALGVIIGVCAGLHHAHEKVGLDGTPLGIVHRDVSPPNVIVTYDGSVKVVDFGIAKAATARSSTGVGTLKGKIPYMSPEQCRGEELDRRSDIFSIGILLYELTVGRRLFQADTEVAIINRIVSGRVVPPTGVHRHYPPELEAIVMRALQPSPAHRCRTARDMQIALEEFACDYRLSLSSARLADFMEGLFDPEARRWPTRAARQVEVAPTHVISAGLGAHATPVSASSANPATRPDLHPFDDDGLARLLADDVGTEASRRAGSADELVDPLGIDLDNLELEDLMPAKFSKPG